MSYLGQEIGGVDSLELKFKKRIEWLKQKLSEMRRVDGPDYTPSELLRGRIEGEIGGTERALELYSEMRKERP